MDKLIVGEHQVDGTRLLIKKIAILTSQVRCYCILYLVSFIVTMYWTKFLYELYSNSRVLVYYIEGHFFIKCFCVNNNCSYSAY